MKLISFFLFIFLLCLKLNAQKLSEEETKLYQIIMAYRAANGLKQIPLSNSLTIVAQTHVRDLYQNRPDTGKCNLHSWSDSGRWTPVCYTNDHANARGMWIKPKELTSYPGNGYEISYGIWGGEAKADGALKSWQSSSGHNSVILNQGIWSGLPWNAIGIGMYKGFAVVWFGNEPDPVHSSK